MPVSTRQLKQQGRGELQGVVTVAWIKIDHTTLDKPEVMQIAEKLSITPEQAFGHLCRVWIWADQQSLNGHAISVTEKALDRVSGHAGFVTAMREAGWLKGKDGALSFPNFDNHNGETAKKRALAYKRQVTHRSRTERDISVTRLEKEKIKKTSNTADVSPVVENLPLRDGSSFPVKQSLVDELSPIYPAVDVPATVREMKGWLLLNPDRRKTRAGVRRFIGNWLQSEQAKHGG